MRGTLPLEAIVILSEAKDLDHVNYIVTASG
jgi:hypothetical protein